MRTPSLNTRFAVACVVTLALVAWMLPALNARVTSPSPVLAGGAGGDDEEPPVPRVYYKAPISTEAASVWIKLQKKAPMRFANETALEDFLKSFREATSDKNDPEGVMIYVDPIGLQEAEKTMASPITLDLSNVRLETALRLALKQLDLTFRVDPDGLIMITCVSSKDTERDDANAMILDKLDALQKQVAELRVRLVGPQPSAKR